MEYTTNAKHFGIVQGVQLSIQEADIIERQIVDIIHDRIKQVKHLLLGLLEKGLIDILNAGGNSYEI